MPTGNFLEHDSLTLCDPWRLQAKTSRIKQIYNLTRIGYTGRRVLGAVPARSRCRLSSWATEEQDNGATIKWECPYPLTTLGPGNVVLFRQKLSHVHAVLI